MIESEIKGQCFGVEISKRNEEIQPVPLDGVERHTYPQGTGAPPCPSTTRREWRYRVGDYRIICDIRDSELIILALSIGHRSSIYQT